MKMHYREPFVPSLIGVSKSLPTSARLQELYTYNSESGILTRKHTSEEQLHMHANGRYFTTKLSGTWFKVHRVIWKLVHDEEPYLVDHIDRDGLNIDLST